MKEKNKIGSEKIREQSMLRRFRAGCLIAIMVFGCAGTLFAHITADVQGFDISSDFGPRTILEKGVSKPNFHKAIDYYASSGTSLPLLEAGIITALF